MFLYLIVYGTKMLYQMLNEGVLHSYLINYCYSQNKCWFYKLCSAQDFNIEYAMDMRSHAYNLSHLKI